jgi:Rhodopirellula transposase DDE domain
MSEMLSEAVKETLEDAAKKLTGHRKRDFMAKVAQDYLNSSARKAESVFGWKRTSVQTGLHERRTGLICLDNYRARGRHKSERVLPNLVADIRSLVDALSQADPQMKSTLVYTQISARAVREALITEKGYEEEKFVTKQTIGTVMNRIGYRLKKSKKPNP